MRGLLPIAAALVISFAPSAPAQNFDFYTFTLSWSPEYCHENPSDHSSECSGNPAWGFVVHGLWPDLSGGAQPQGCPAAPYDPTQIPQGMAAIMPPEIYQHEWEKHGVCSGMRQLAYFTKIASLYRQITIPIHDTGQDQQIAPSAMRTQLSTANPGFPATSFSIQDTQNSLSAIEVCMAKSFAALSCPKQGDTRSTPITVRARP